MSEVETVEMPKDKAEIFAKAYSILERLTNDADVGLDTKRNIEKISEGKISFPELKTIEGIRKPLDDRYTALEAENKKLREEWESDKKTRSEKEEEKNILSSLADIQKKYNLNDDGMEKVKKRAVEKNNPDLESAAAWVAAQEPKGAPIKDSPSYLPSKMNLYGSAEKDSEWEGWNKDPLGMADKEIVNIMNSPEQYAEFGGTR